MSGRRTNGTVLQLGVALTLLLLSVVAPVLWLSEPEFQPPPPQSPEPSPIELSRRAARLVVPEVLPAVTDPWDELQKLSSEPTQAPAGSLVASRYQPIAQEKISALPVFPELEEPLAPSPTPRLVVRTTPHVPAMISPPVPKTPPPLWIERKSSPQPRGWQRWPTAEQLLADLDKLTGIPATAAWVTATSAQLNELSQCDATYTNTAPIIRRLRQLEQAAPALADQLPALLRHRLLMTNYALMRRLSVWEIASQIGDGSMQVPMIDVPVDLPAIVEDTRSWLQRRDADGWAAYLLLDELAAAAPNPDPLVRSRLMQRFHLRVEADMSAEQHDFLQAPEIKTMLSATGRWASAVAWEASLLTSLEHVELGDAQAAQRVACLSRSLSWSHDSRMRRLGKQLDLRYRNANLRVSFSEAFLNRLVKNPEPTVQPFRDSILGARVTGTNHVSTEMGLALVPNDSHWHVLIQAAGEVHSDTIARKGPAIVFSNGLSHYVAEKDVWVNGDEVRSGRSHAAADLRTNLRGFRTRFDGIPVVGGVTRAVVKRQHDKQLPRANAIARQKASNRIRQEMDLEVERQLDEAQLKLERLVSKPMRALNLDPVATELTTSDHNALARVRLASTAQLAAFTPRPVAPASAVAELQVHQSAANNVLVGLELAGRRTTIGKVSRHIATRFGQDDWTPPEDLPERVIIEFSQTRPVYVTAENGVLRLHLKLTELDAGRNNFWYDFDVYADYEPVVDGMQLKLKRVSQVHIIGDEFSIADMAKLKAVFAKVFAPQRMITLIESDWAGADSMQDLKIIQCVISEGWMGVALGPATVASQGLSSTSRPSVISRKLSDQSLSGPSLSGRNSSGRYRR